MAVIDGQIVGQAAHTFRVERLEKRRDLVDSKCLCAFPDFRGKGVFRALFSHIKVLGEAEADCCGIRLYIERAETITARESYRRIGFTETAM